MNFLKDQQHVTKFAFERTFHHENVREDKDKIKPRTCPRDTSATWLNKSATWPDKFLKYLSEQAKFLSKKTTVLMRFSMNYRFFDDFSTCCLNCLSCITRGDNCGSVTSRGMCIISFSYASKPLPLHRILHPQLCSLYGRLHVPAFG